MLVKTRAIVFRSVKYGDSSLIVDLYTEEMGLRSYLLSGVRKSGGKGRAALFQVSSLIEVVAYQQDGKSLQRLKDFQLWHPYQTLLFEVVKSASAIFLIELTRKIVKERESNPALFAFISEWLLHLDQPQTKSANLPWAFMAQLSRHIGFEPNGHYAPETPHFDLREGSFTEDQPHHAFFLDPEPASWLSQALYEDPEEIQHWAVPKAIRRDLLDKMILYYQLHIEGFKGLSSPDILRLIL